MKTLAGIGALSLVSLCACASTATPGATPSLTLTEVQTRWIAALGGRDALAGVHAVHLTADIETGGLKGSYESWNDASGHLRESTHIGAAIQQDDILAGDQAWVLDISGTVHAQSGSDLQDLVSQEYESSYSQLLSGRMPGHMELVGPDPARHAYVLRLQADGGKSVTVYLDAASFLPQSESTQQGSQTQVTSYSGWHAVEGVQFPGKVVQSTGDPKYDVTLTLRAVQLNPPLDAGLFAKPAGTAVAVRFDSPGQAVQAPFELYGGHIYLPVGVNGSEPAIFVVDSGAEASAIDKAYAGKLDIRSEGQLEISGTGGSDSMSIAKGLEFRILGVHIPTQAVAVLPFDGLTPLTGRPVYGILGFDVLSRFVVRIDYAARTLTFYDPASFKYSGKGAVLPFTFQGNDVQIGVTVTLPGHPPLETRANIDTGATSTELTRPFVDANDVVKAVGTTVERPGFGLGGSYAELDGRISSVQIGPYLLQRPLVGLSRAKQGDLNREDLGVNLGTDILERFTVTIDYAHQQLMLEPNADLDKPFHGDASGLVLLAKGADFRSFEVFNVAPESPAANAGLLKGDIIDTIDGVSAAHYRRGDIMEMFKQDGRVYALGIRRGSRHVEVSLRLHESI